MRRLILILALVGCIPDHRNESDGDRYPKPDYAWRQSKLTLHTVAPGVCVVVWHNGSSDGVAIASVTCPAAEAH